MFERFTDRARRVVVLAQEEARAMKHNYIGTEHILLGLSKEGEGLAAKALKAYGDQDLSYERLRAAVEDIIGLGSSDGKEHLPFTPRAKKVLELSLREALQLRHGYIGTEHIMLGLMRENEGVAAQAFKSLSVNLSQLREVLMQMINGYTGGENPEAGEELVGAGAGGGGSASTKSGSAILDQYGSNLTDMARRGKLDPVIGRNTETERIVQILSRRTKNNPILLGEPGVGKTAVVEGLAQRMVAGDVPATLRDKTLYSLDLGSMVAGSRYRGDFEERIKKILKEVTRRGDIILFIDEIHTLIGAGSAEGSLDAASLLKPMLARGELKVIGATTQDEYRKYFEKDAAMVRRFQPVKVEQPSVSDAIEILKGLREAYEKHHRVLITDNAIKAAVNLSHRYITDSFLPDKAIDLIDEAGARMRIQLMSPPAELKAAEEELRELKAQREQALAENRYDEAADLGEREKKAEEHKERLEKEWREGSTKPVGTIDEDEIAEVLAMSTGIPVQRLNEKETQKLINMEAELHKRVIGQEQAVTALARSIRRTRAGLKDPNRPGGSFIFAGPTGVGKTELAKALAELLFGDESALIQMDMSEFSEKHTSSRLFGAPAGYVGYEDGGQLTEAVRRRPFSVVLFDEVEKAHPDIFNTLLQVLEDGHLTDGQGRVVDFKNTIIILTTNLGARDISKSVQTGFQREQETTIDYDRMQSRVREELKQNFRPEFLNRIDEVIVFPQLTKPEIKQIVDLMIRKVSARMEELGMRLAITEAARDELAERGFDPVLGARPLRRTIQREVEDLLSEKILFGEIHAGQSVVIDAVGDENQPLEGEASGEEAQPGISLGGGARSPEQARKSPRHFVVRAE